jgi:hypothetical protein
VGELTTPAYDISRQSIVISAEPQISHWLRRSSFCQDKPMSVPSRRNGGRRQNVYWQEDD